MDHPGVCLPLRRAELLEASRLAGYMERPISGSPSTQDLVPLKGDISGYVGIYKGK